MSRRLDPLWREKTSRAWRAAVAVATLLAGCAGGIGVDHESADGVTLYWHKRDSSIDQAAAKASAHCRTFGKRAVLLDEFEDTDVTTAHFACR